MTSPPKPSSASSTSSSDHHNKLVNRLGLATLSLSTSSSSSTRWRVMVLGHQSVGKSAFVVRFLTRRFIGDYDPKCQKTYCISTALNGDQINLELLDAGGHYLEDGGRHHQSELEAKIRWADAFVLIYSVTDKCSFDECCRLRFLIGYNKRRRKHLFGSTFGHGPIDYGPNSGVSVVLVANKVDQIEDRMVTTEEGEKRSRDLGCDHFFEISVREEADIARRVVESLHARWRQQHNHHHHHPLPHIVHNATPHHQASIKADHSSHFGRRCLETFAGRCSSSSSSMDVINERDDDVLAPASLSLESPVQDNRNHSPPENFRSRASTEGSLSFYKKKRAGKHHLLHAVEQQPSPLDQSPNSSKPPSRRMSMSLRGANSVF